MMTEQHYKLLVDSLRLLAASFEEQKKYLPDLADVPSDVVEDFESSFMLLPALIEANKIPMASIASILRLFNRVEWCLRNIDLDDFSSAEWNKVREMARETLQVMGEPVDLN